MLSKFFSCALVCLLALTSAITIGCSGSGSPLVPDIQEITIVSPITGSEWGSPQGVWEIIFSSPTPTFGNANLDYNIVIDNNPVILNSFQDLENEKGILAHIVVSTLSIGDHQLVVEAMLFDQVIAKGQTNFMVKPERELSITITEPNVNSDWDIGDTMSIIWKVVGDQVDNFEVSYSEDAIKWHTIKKLPGVATFIDWKIPVVDNPGASTFKIRVEAVVADTIITDVESDSFRIDYGPAISLSPRAMLSDHQELPVPFSIGTPFMITATAKDRFGNEITNYQTELLVIGYLNGVPIAGNFLGYSTLGDGHLTGIWDSGTVSFFGYQISNSFGLPPGVHIIYIVVSDGTIMAQTTDIVVSVI